MTRVCMMPGQWMVTPLYRIKRQIFLLNFLNILLACSLFAQSGDNPGDKPALKIPVIPQNVSFDTLTEGVAIELALDRSIELQSLDTNVQIAGYRLESSGSINNPELRLSEISSRYITYRFDELRIGLRWRPPKLGELAEERQEARVDVWTRKVRATRFRHDLIAKVRRNYASVIMYDRLADLARKRQDLETERLAIVDRMVELGRRSVVYQTKAKMWHAESRNDYARAIQRQRLARRKLAKRVGLSEDFTLTMEELPEITLDIDRLIAIAVENRPEIELVQQRIQLATKQYNFEHRKLIPWPRFIDLSYHRLSNREDWGEMRIGIELPIFNWNRGNIRATNLAVKRKELESEAIREEIEYEVRDAYEIYQDFLLDWKSFGQEVEELMEEAQEVVEQARQHNTLQPDEVQEMELTIIETQKILSEKRRDLAHALIDLTFVLGIEDPEKLQQPEEG